MNLLVVVALIALLAAIPKKKQLYRIGGQNFPIDPAIYNRLIFNQKDLTKYETGQLFKWRFDRSQLSPENWDRLKDKVYLCQVIRMGNKIGCDGRGYFNPENMIEV